MNWKSLSSLALLLSLSLLLTPHAKADSWDFTITGGATASGVITLGTPYTCAAHGSAPILSMAGIFDGSPITLLNPATQSGCLDGASAQVNPHVSFTG
jgi:hypothetical protein